MATQAEVAEHLFLTQPEVSRHLAAGVLPQAGRGDLDIEACREAYIRHLRERAAGRASDAADENNLDLVLQRARLASEQADAQAMKNAAARGEMIPRGDVVHGIRTVFTHLRAKLLAVPNKAAPLLIGAKSPEEIGALLTIMVHDALADLASTRILPERPDGAPGGDGAGGGPGGPGAATEADDQRMG